MPRLDVHAVLGEVRGQDDDVLAGDRERADRGGDGTRATRGEDEVIGRGARAESPVEVVGDRSTGGLPSVVGRVAVQVERAELLHHVADGLVDRLGCRRRGVSDREVPEVGLSPLLEGEGLLADLANRGLAGTKLVHERIDSVGHVRTSPDSGPFGPRHVS